jgi:hypothetical protein
MGTTPGWYDGKTVTFTYSRNFVCTKPPAAKASSGCEAGSDYDSVPASSFDPLYVIVPLGFTPSKKTLACPVAGHCVDHPSTIDLSAVFSGAKYDNVKLPAQRADAAALVQVVDGGPRGISVDRPMADG